MTPKENMARAMACQSHDTIPVMCQMANGHTVLNTGVHPIDYWVDSQLWAACLLQMRCNYDFDGILVHKPGRLHGIMDRVARADYDAEIPTLHMPDGGRIECTRNDDAYYKGTGDFRFPTIAELDLEDLLGWAPDSFREFQSSKGTLPVTDPEAFESHVFATIDQVIAEAGDQWSVHGEVRSPFDHLVSLTGMQGGLIGLLDEPDKSKQVLETTLQWSLALAVAQARRGAAAIKISSPFAGSAFLSRKMYIEFILPYERRLAKAVRDEGVAVYTHTCGAIGDRLDLLCEAGVSGMECLDPPPIGNVEIEEAVQQLKGRMFIKGNVDPVNTLLRGDPDQVSRDVTRILEATRAMPGFILSSACSVAPPTPPENLKHMVETCRKFQP